MTPERQAGESRMSRVILGVDPAGPQTDATVLFRVSHGLLRQFRYEQLKDFFASGKVTIPKAETLQRWEDELAAWPGDTACRPGRPPSPDLRDQI